MYDSSFLFVEDTYSWYIEYHFPSSKIHIHNIFEIITSLRRKHIFMMFWLHSSHSSDYSDIKCTISWLFLLLFSISLVFCSLKSLLRMQFSAFSLDMKVSFAVLTLFSFLTLIVENSQEFDVLILVHVILSTIFFKQHDSSLFCSHIFDDESDLHKRTILLRQAHH